jgi:hypothetical protein
MLHDRVFLNKLFETNRVRSNGEARVRAEVVACYLALDVLTTVQSIPNAVFALGLHERRIRVTVCMPHPGNPFK